MLQRKHKGNQKSGKIKCMNCVLLIIVAVLALVIYPLCKYLSGREGKDLSQVVFRWLLGAEN